MYKLEKWVWSHDDFDLMGWHDVTVHALAVIPERWELLLDIDYILSWVKPEPPDAQFTFRVAPATLVFEGVQDIKINFDIGYIQHIDLQGIERKGPIPAPNCEYIDWNWMIVADQGEITFRAGGYKQYIRRAPIRQEEQWLGYSERGGLSFERSAAAADT